MSKSYKTAMPLWIVGVYDGIELRIYTALNPLVLALDRGYFVQHDGLVYEIEIFTSPGLHIDTDEVKRVVQRSATGCPGLEEFHVDPNWIANLQNRVVTPYTELNEEIEKRNSNRRREWRSALKAELGVFLP